MCTAVTYKTKDFYFGRTLDYEFSYGEEITVTPRNYIFDFRHIGQLKSHYAIIGMAFVSEGYPLYYDAVNEKGLGMAGLNFVGNAAYKASVCGEKDIAQFEFIPWILSQCATVSEARAKLDGINLTGTPFSSQLPAAQLHWIIADKDEAITVESMKDGLHIYDNPVGVLTNNPPFNTEEESVSQFFHILGSVEQQRGCCEVTDGKYEITIYTSCCNAAKGIYYYTTYDNHQITAVDMHKENLDGTELIRYPIITKGEVRWQNR